MITNLEKNAYKGLLIRNCLDLAGVVTQDEDDGFSSECKLFCESTFSMKSIFSQESK